MVFSDSLGEYFSEVYSILQTLIKISHATRYFLSMAWGFLIKGPLQTATEDLIKFLHKLMRHNVYASVRRLVRLACTSDTDVQFQRGSVSPLLFYLSRAPKDMQIVKADVTLWTNPCWRPL